jgi:aryl-alcohol dehydrogenase-like predicted oxidoreductase
MGTTAELTPGRATRAGTQRFAGRFGDRPQHFRAPDGIALSSIGFGTRGGSAAGGDDLLYRSAIAQAVDLGINVFDTALSYRMQRSERTLGATLRRAFAEERVARDEVFVITKGGYLTADPDFAHSPAEARRYLIQTYVDSGLVDPEQVVNGTHSLDPAFIVDQIERSRRNLGLATIDLYCLEEPELHLLGKGPTEFRDLLAELFLALEGAVRKGAIAAYGLSTWSGLLVPYSERGHLSLLELLELALEVGGGDHHLRGVLLPYSLGMGEALGLPSQFGPEGQAGSILEAVIDTGTAVFACAPLVRGRAVRGFPHFIREALPGLTSDAQRSLQFVRSSPGITTALVGMRRPDHVEDNAALSQHAPAPPEVIQSLFERARSDE